MDKKLKENEVFQGVTENRAFSLAKSFSYHAGKLLAIVMIETDSIEVIEIATENNAKYTFPFQHEKFGRRGSYKKCRGSVTEIRLNRYKFLPKLTPEEFAFVKSWFVKRKMTLTHFGCHSLSTVSKKTMVIRLMLILKAIMKIIWPLLFVGVNYNGCEC